MVNEETKFTPPYATIFSVMLITFMVVLDSSIANVSLPYIAGSFSATNTESMWVLTSYLIANGVILPSTAWFSTMFGRKKFLLISTVIFTLASFMCGVSHSMQMLIFWRVVQGIGGGAIMPIAQAIILEVFPKEDQAKGMSIYGIGIIFAPIIGPTLGGWITDTYSWHWIFLINVPIGILAVIMANATVKDPDYAKKGKIEKIDYWGFIYLALWLLTLQYVLDNGQHSDWFEASWVRWTFSASCFFLIAFIYRQLTFDKPIIDLKVFLDRNFTVGCLLVAMQGAILYSTLAILPIFLQHLLGYTAFLSGLTISPRGIGSLLGIAMCSYLSRKFDMRWIIFAGFVILGVSNLMFGDLNLQISKVDVIIPNIVCGFGLSLSMVSLSAIAFITLKNEQLTNATGIFALLRSVGGAIGVSLVSTLIERKGQIYQAYMVQHLNFANPVYNIKFNALFNAFASQMNAVTAHAKAEFMMYGQLLQQANLMAFVDLFRLYGVLCILVSPMVFFFNKTKFKKSQNTAMME